MYKFFLRLIISIFSIIFHQNDGNYGIFFCWIFLLQYLKIVKICMSYIWLCDFMFCNTYILFFEFFMCKVLGLRFLYYKVMTYFLIFFGLGPKLEIDQAF
jgi:hypothetical protein